MRRGTIILAVGLTAALIASCGRKQEPATGQPLARGVKIERVAFSPIEEYYEAVGTVRSKTASALSSKIMGNIVATHVHEGDRVRAGQLLIEIDDREGRAQLQKAQAGLREAQNALDEIERSIDAAESARDAAQANRSLASATFDRYRSLLERRSVSRQEFDEVQARQKVAEAEADRAAKMVASLDARKKQVLAKIEQAQADLANAQVYAGYSRITSPINGIVTAKQAEVGQTASPGASLVSVEDDSRYRLEIAVEESLLGRIRLKDPARIRIDAFGDRELDGRVVEIVPASDPSSRSYTVRIELPPEAQRTGAGPFLRSGLFGKARFSVGQTRGITIPQKAVVQRGQLIGVYVLDESNTVHLRLIKTGKSYDDRIEVLAGVNEGERIVVDGVEAVSDGSRAQIAELDHK